MAQTISTAALNAIAALALNGDYFAGTRTDTRLATWDYREFVFGGGPNDRLYELTEAGRAILPQAPLWKAAEYLKARGYRLVRDRRSKPGNVKFVNPETGQSAAIYDGRHVYEQPPAGQIGWVHTFTAKRGA
jgi:hypothetical protein